MCWCMLSCSAGFKSHAEDDLPCRRYSLPGYCKCYPATITALPKRLFRRTPLKLTTNDNRVAIPAVVQLLVFRSSYPSQNLTYDLWLPTVCNQIVACISVVTACVPYLRPFMESIEPDNVVQIGDEDTSSSRGTTERRLALRELTTAPTDYCHLNEASTS